MSSDQESLSSHKQEHPFYGIEIIRRREQAYIEKLLKKYRHEAVTDELKSKIWEELQLEKYQGRLTIPFKLVMKQDALKKYPDSIEVILDTKV